MSKGDHWHMGVLGSRNLGFCRYRVTDRFPFLGYQSIGFKAYWGPPTHYYRLSRGPQPRYPGTVNDGSGHFMVFGAPDRRMFSTQKSQMECLKSTRCDMGTAVYTSRLPHQAEIPRLRIGLPSVLLIQHGPFLRLQRRVDFHNHSGMRRRR